MGYKQTSREVSYMSVHFEGETANELWCLAARELLKKRGQQNVPSRNGETTEILHVTFSLKNPRDRWVNCRVPPISIAFALAEIVAIINGCNDAALLNNWNPALPIYQGPYVKYPGSYGYRLRYNFGFDQINRAYETLKSNPNSRQAVMIIWDPNIDLPQVNGMPNNLDVPCNICSILKVRENKLYWTQVIRSNDIVLGVPYNFVQFTFLQEIMAGWLGIDTGEYFQMSDSLHLYDNSILEVLDKEPIHNSDILSTDKNSSEKYFKDIYNNMLLLCSQRNSPQDIMRYSNIENLTQPYNNIMAILSAYIAFKSKYNDIIEKIISKCTNAIYVNLWTEWMKSRK